MVRIRHGHLSVVCRSAYISWHLQAYHTGDKSAFSGHRSPNLTIELLLHTWAELLAI
jgi:hypothetical protein